MEKVDALISWGGPIPGTLGRHTGEDNHSNGGNGGHHYHDDKCRDDLAESQARKDPTIGHEDGTFDEAGSSDIANVADEKGKADTHCAGNECLWIDVPDMLSQTMLRSIDAGTREQKCRQASCEGEIWKRVRIV